MEQSVFNDCLFGIHFHSMWCECFVDFHDVFLERVCFIVKSHNLIYVLADVDVDFLSEDSLFRSVQCRRSFFLTLVHYISTVVH